MMDMEYSLLLAMKEVREEKLENERKKLQKGS
jgi:hypothetical protein